MRKYERRLPHWDVVGGRLFVTFRLYGSLPSNRVFPPDRLTGGRAFVAMDRILDRAACGPVFLKQPDIAEVIVNAVIDGSRRFNRYELHSFVVMANHVHLLVTTRTPMSVWLRSLKGFTGHEANRILNRHRQPFWQDESFDRLVRDDPEFARIRHYIEWNPVKAGVVASPEEFLWSSAGPKPGGRPEGLTPPVK